MGVSRGSKPKTTSWQEQQQFSDDHDAEDLDDLLLSEIAQREPPPTKCQCCHTGKIALMCPGCWGAHLCRKCAHSLHRVIPTVLLQRAKHVLDADLPPVVVKEGEEPEEEESYPDYFAAGHGIQVRRGKENHLVISNRPQFARPGGVWRPKDVEKSLQISQVHRAMSPVRTPPVESLEVLPRHVKSPTRGQRPASAGPLGRSQIISPAPIKPPPPPLTVVRDKRAKAR